MFDRLNKKIYKTILILTTTFILLISIVSVTSLSSYLTSDFKQSSVDMINLAITNFNFDMSLIKSSADIIAQNDDVKNYLTSTASAQNAINKISSLSNYFDSVLGATLYDNDSVKSISTTTISGYPTFSELKTISSINSFVNSNNTDSINIRTTNIADFYNSTTYNESYGMISYIIKIYNDSSVISGYLVVDINPEFVYLKHFSFSTYENFESIISLITTSDNSYMKYSNNLNMDQYLKDNRQDNIYLANYQNYVYKTTIIDEYQLICVIPSANIFYKIYFLIGLFIIIDIISIFITYYIASKMANYVTVPLNKLLNRMKNDEITNNNT